MLPVRTALAIAALLFIEGLILAYLLNFISFILLISYIVINLLYTIRLKNMVIIDVMIIAYGFVVRAVVGAMCIDGKMTPWFVLCVMFLSLFLALGKRRQELVELSSDEIREGRKVLKFYSIHLLDQLMSIVTSAVLICYSLFAIDSGTNNNREMFYTIPLVVYGMFYYLYFVQVKNGGEAPDEALYKEKPILVVVLLYILFLIVIRN